MSAATVRRNTPARSKRRALFLGVAANDRLPAACSEVDSLLISRTTRRCGRKGDVHSVRTKLASSVMFLPTR